jgi:NADH:ubiquinone reductase (H+-translocating)
MEPDRRPHAVVVGAGFAGLEAAKLLGKSGEVRLTVVDRRNHHLFQPLLYQVATAALDTSDIAAPIRGILRRQRNTEVVLSEVVSVDRAARRLHFAEGGTLDYDHLIVAAGALDAYFSRPDWEPLAPGLKSLEDALEIRRRVLFAFEEAERETDPALRRAWLTFVLIGGGPTGVELAGSLSEIAHRALLRDFRHINTHDTRIVLIEGLPRILPFYSERLGEKARQALERLRIEVRTGARVTDIDAEGVWLGDEHIAARTVLWGAGVKASPLGQALGGPVDKAGRVQVTPELYLPGDDRVSVVGDLAWVRQDGKLIPGVAPAAMQMGRHAARNVLRAVRSEPAQPFRYDDRGTFAVIGRGSAVGVLGSKWEVWGFAAWWIWLSVHLIYLVGFRNRVAVMAKWAYSYLTWRRVARLITFTPWLRLRQGILTGESAAALPPAAPSASAGASNQPAPVHAARSGP